MSAAIPLPVRQNTPAWVDARRDVIGSSDIPIITGNSPYRTSLFSLWAIKTRLAEPEPIDPETQELFDLGHALEPVIAERYAIATGRRPRRLTRMLVSRELPWAGASIDFMDGRDILEIKWVPNRRWDVDGDEPVPAGVQDQVQWQMFVKGADRAFVACLIGGRFRWFEVERSDAYIDDLRYLAKHKLRDLIESRTPPPVDGSESTTLTLGRMYPRHTAPMLEPTPEMDALALRIRETTLAAREADEAKGQARNAMRLLIENAEGVTNEGRLENGLHGYRIYWRRSADRPEREVVETDWQAVARAYRWMLDQQVGTDAEPPDESLRAIAGSLRPDQLDAIEALHTSTRTEEAKEGTRVLRPYFMDEETGKWL